MAELPYSRLRYQATVVEGTLTIAEDRPLYDGPVTDGVSSPKAFLTTEKHSVENGKLMLVSVEQDFSLDLSTMQRTPGDHRVELKGSEVDSVLGDRE